ncbi:hypothetical protein QQF64_015229 [Cirrhinus molitorella]|uniref:Uncharacterized protein n=1 Tax=Cirrhinus molitorella TaxID=172907 RepID=A0ABR3NUN1_9TELE
MDSSLRSSVSWADNNYWMSWNKWDEVIDWCQEEKPAPERRVQEQKSFRLKIRCHAGRTTNELWVPKMIESLSLAGKIPGLTDHLG